MHTIIPTNLIVTICKRKGNMVGKLFLVITNIEMIRIRGKKRQPANATEKTWESVSCYA